MSLIGAGHYFPSDVSKKGIFNTYLNLITYDCSSTDQGNCANIFKWNTTHSVQNFWISGKNDPYFQVFLKRGYIYPVNGVIFSCHDSPCLKDFVILGIKKGENDFKEICSYTVSSDSEFKGETSLYPCSFDKPLKAVKIENRGSLANGDTRFALYIFDFYGYISFGFCTFSQSLHITFIPSIFLLFVY